MSGLFAALHAGSKALTAQSVAVETASRNLANVNNPNYARQRVVFGDRGQVPTAQGPQSSGLEALAIEQLRDSLLDQQVVREVALKGRYEAEQAGYQNAQAGLGETIDSAGETGTTGAASSGSGVSAAIANFFNAFQSFSASPTDPGERQTLVQQAGVLSDRIQATDTRLAQVQSDLTTQAQTDIATANTLMSQISTLNDQIARLELNNPGAAVDLRDQRNAKLEELADKIGIDSRPDPAGSGRIQVYAKDSAGASVVLIDYSGQAGPLSLSGSTVSGGTPATAISLGGGSIQGAINARDTGVKDLRDGLNNLANQLVISVNAAYNPTGATGNFFTASGTTGATFSVDSSVTASNLKASDGGAAGDSTIAQAVAKLATKVFSTGAGDRINGSFGQHFAKTVSSFGQVLSTTNLNVKQQTTVESMVRNRRDSVSGVSLDEEMTDLLKYQRSYQASAKVIQVIDELLDTVVNRLGI